MSTKNIEFKFYEPNQGLEELQVNIFNKNNPNANQPALASTVKERYEREKINPKTVRYAFYNAEMVAYIQVRIREKLKEAHLGFPWALDNSPEGIQDQLFDDMIEYIKKEYPDYKIRVNIGAKPQNRTEFIKKRGFEEKNTYYLNFLNLKELSELDYNNNFNSRIASEADIDSLVKIMKDDGRYTGQFNSDEDILKYFKEKVLATGHLVMIYEGDSFVAASAPLIFKLPQQNIETVILRFTAFRDIKNQTSFKPLLIEVAKECVRTGYGSDKSISVFTDGIETPSEQVKIIEEFKPKKEPTFYYFYLS